MRRKLAWYFRRALVNTAQIVQKLSPSHPRPSAQHRELNRHRDLIGVQNVHLDERRVFARLLLLRSRGFRRRDDRSLKAAAAAATARRRRAARRRRCGGGGSGGCGDVRIGRGAELAQTMIADDAPQFGWVAEHARAQMLRRQRPRGGERHLEKHKL